MLVQLDAHLRRVYPSGDLYELRVDQLDGYCHGGVDCTVVGRLGAIAAATVDVMPLDLEWARSREVNIGLAATPSWLHFNRAMSDRERMEEVVRQGGSLVFWTVCVSRVAPVWHGRWNEFRRRRGAVIPAEIPRPSAWSEVVQSVQGLLRAAKYYELSPEEASVRVRWMKGCTTPVSVGGDDRPTLDECLFLEY